MLSESKGTIKILKIMIDLSLGTKHWSGYQGNKKLMLSTSMFSILTLKKICNQFHWYVPYQGLFKHSPYKTCTILFINNGRYITNTTPNMSLVEWQISFVPYYSPLNIVSLINSWLNIVTEWLELLILIQEMPSTNLHPWDLLPWLQTIIVLLLPYLTNTTPVLQIRPIHFLPHIFPILYWLTII